MSVVLQSIWFADESTYTVGRNATRIILVKDGNGPMGHYDRIHVYGASGDGGSGERVFPAHHVHGWHIAGGVAQGPKEPTP